MAKNTDRDIAIYEKRKAGASTAQLAEEFGLSRERVRSIVLRVENAFRKSDELGLERTPDYTTLRRWKRERYISELIKNGLTLQEIQVDLANGWKYPTLSTVRTLVRQLAKDNRAVAIAYGEAHCPGCRCFEPPA